MKNTRNNYYLPFIMPTSAYNISNSINSVENHGINPQGYANLAGKTKAKTFTCKWCSRKFDGEPAYRCSSHFLGDKKFCSYACNNSHWSAEHI